MTIGPGLVRSPANQPARSSSRPAQRSPNRISCRFQQKRASARGVVAATVARLAARPAHREVPKWRKPKRSDTIDMVTLFRVMGLRVVIYSNDHWPPHVHVIGPDREARIALGSAGQYPSVLTNEGLSRRQLAAALIEVERNSALLLQRWREIHGDA